MTVATERRLSIAEYLAYEDGSDDRCELVDGELVKMALGTGKHSDISDFITDELRAEIKRSGAPWIAKMMSIAIQSPRGTRWGTARIPDVVVLPLTQWEAMADREAFIPLNEPPPLLVVEVVSPSTISTDYRTKYAEYAVLDIPEYWIADPLESQVTVGALSDGFYANHVFAGNQAIVSPTFPGLKLTAEQVLRAGKAIGGPP
jgi:Uma2 family endonuclease